MGHAATLRFPSPLIEPDVERKDMPAQLANESFRADHVRFGNSVGAVVQVPMRSDVLAAEAFFRDHLLFDHPSITEATKWTAAY